MKMFISDVKADFLADKGVGADGAEVVSVGDSVFVVGFEPVLLNKAEYLKLLGKAKNHEVEVTV